jgi:DNA segregation ATPase FtsK/SpoIIIE, S-DNA-T family
MVPLFYGYKYESNLHRRLEMGGVFALLFFALLFFQAMVVEGPYRGAFGGSVADFLAVYIGTFGLWTFWLIGNTST